MADVSVSRRAVTGMLALLPIISATAANAHEGGTAEGGCQMNMHRQNFELQIATSEWDEAVASFRAANSAWLSHPYPRTSPNHPAYDELEKANDVLLDEQRVAFEELMQTDAPDFAALRCKLSELVENSDDYGSQRLVDAYYVECVLADLERLAKLA